jgi:hypothetical protein
VAASPRVSSLTTRFAASEASSPPGGLLASDAANLVVSDETRGEPADGPSAGDDD